MDNLKGKIMKSLDTKYGEYSKKAIESWVKGDLKGETKYRAKREAIHDVKVDLAKIFEENPDS